MLSMKTSALLLLLLLIAISTWPLAHAFRRQSAAVRGRLTCAGIPASNVLVKLFDEDDGPDPDDLLDSKYTDADGNFYLSGDTVELTNIDPEVRIYHTCNQHIPFKYKGTESSKQKIFGAYWLKLCKREWVIGIPDKYITAGNVPTKVMDLGELNLELELEDESRDCIH